MKNNRKTKWLIHIEKGTDGYLLFYVKVLPKIIRYVFILLSVMMFLLKEFHYH